ncbi:MAG: iron chaperone [Bacillus sp. (in: Bacteria)]|nr:iron chaperone [Bacillus sp. (in: firmicutes)]
METIDDFLKTIDNDDHRDRTKEVLTWVQQTFPHLEPTIKWKQPMFTDHGTYIIGFSVAKHHLAVAPERVTINQFTNDIVEAGYEHTNELVRFKWDRPTNFSLLQKMIEFNIEDKADCSTFWRK